MLVCDGRRAGPTADLSAPHAPAEGPPPASDPTSLPQPATVTLSLPVLFEHASFTTPYSKLHVKGSCIHKAFWVIWGATGRLDRIILDARHPDFNCTTLSVPCPGGLCISIRPRPHAPNTSP